MCTYTVYMMNVSKMIPLYVIDGASEGLCVKIQSCSEDTRQKKKIKYCLEINYERKIE